MGPRVQVPYPQGADLSTALTPFERLLGGEFEKVGRHRLSSALSLTSTDVMIVRYVGTTE
jgi:hypothetical protein